MKEESHYSLSGRHLFPPLIILVFTTMIFWAGEKRVTLFSPVYPFMLPHSNSSSDHLVDATNAPTVSLNPKHPMEEENSSLITTAEANQPAQSFGSQAINLSTSFSPQVNASDGNQTSSKVEVCNYAKGKWIADSRPTFYSGYRCKRWLSPAWACRLTNRTDFSYENYRWQPENCKTLEFDQEAFLRRMWGKTIAFIGDSLGRQQFQSLMCMATGGNDRSQVEDVGKEYGLIKPPGAVRPNGYAYRFTKTNTTILHYWSTSLTHLTPINKTDPNTKIAMHLDRPAAFMSQFLGQFNVLVLNTGHHWNRRKFKLNRWVIYINGKPNEDKELAMIENAKNFTVHSVIKWLDSQISFQPRLKAFFRTISPRHFLNGNWDTGGNCDETVPFIRGSEVMQDGSSDEVVENAVNGTRVKILDITAISQLRYEAHISRYGYMASKGINDCLHWCLPGIPDTWNELLIAQL